MSLTKVTYRMIDGAAVNVRDFGATGDGITDDTLAIQAAVTSAVANKKSLFFPSGTYLCNDTVGTISCSMEGTNFNDAVIRYAGANADFIVFNGKTIENLTFEAANPAHATNFTRTSASFQSFNNCRWLGPLLASDGCLLTMNQAIDIEINGCFFQYHNISIIGQDPSGTGFCNGVTISNTLLAFYRTCAIKNPGQGWNLEQVLFEHTPPGAPLANGVLAIAYDASVTSSGLSLTGCWFGDNTSLTAHSYISFRGSGLSITGCYINGSGANNCTLIETVGTSSGIFVAGNYISNFGSVVKTNDLATSVTVIGNTLRLVLSDIVGTYSNVIPATGVKFPATNVPSTDPNTLDDYEEGTFEPGAFFGDSQVGTFVLSKNIGHYVKVGRSVTISVFLRWTSIPTGGQFLRFNLPFANLPTDGSHGLSGFAIPSHEGTYSKLLGGATVLSSSAVAQVNDNTTSASASYTYAQIPSVGGLTISGTYVTAS